MDRSQFTFYRSFWDAVKRLKRKDDRLSALEAICSYALDGETTSMTDAAEALFFLIKPVLDSAARKSEGGKKSKAQRKEAAKIDERPCEDTGKMTERCGEDSGNEGEKKKKIEKEKEIENECSPPNISPPQEKPVRHKHGTYGWVRLTDDEYKKLTIDLGEQELNRCITFIDESAQQNGNRNGWKDWNLVLRKCSREGWGKRREGRSDYGHSGNTSPGNQGDSGRRPLPSRKLD